MSTRLLVRKRCGICCILESLSVATTTDVEQMKGGTVHVPRREGVEQVEKERKIKENIEKEMLDSIPRMLEHL